MTPEIIAYPNGNVSQEIIESACEIGLRLGMVSRSGKNRLHGRLSTTASMTLKRFMLCGSRSIGRQCQVTRSSVSLYRILGDLRARTRTSDPTERPA